MQQAELDLVIGAFGLAMSFLLQLSNVLTGAEAGKLVSEERCKIGDKLAAQHLKYVTHAGPYKSRRYSQRLLATVGGKKVILIANIFKRLPWPR